MSRRLRERLRSALAVIAWSAAAAGCGERTPTGAMIGDVSLAKGGGGGGGGGSGPTPVVNATDPSSAPQDVRLDVRVLGSNYDNGSAVRFLLNGKATTKVVVNSTRFVSATELVADVAIALDAVVDVFEHKVGPRNGARTGPM